MDLHRYRDKDLVKELTQRIADVCPKDKVNIMEVCGTHTMAIARYGLRGLMPDGRGLYRGPDVRYA